MATKKEVEELKQQLAALTDEVERLRLEQRQRGEVAGMKDIAMMNAKELETLVKVLRTREQQFYTLLGAIDAAVSETGEPNERIARISRILYHTRISPSAAVIRAAYQDIRGFADIHVNRPQPFGAEVRTPSFHCGKPGEEMHPILRFLLRETLPEQDEPQRAQWILFLGREKRPRERWPDGIRKWMFDQKANLLLLEGCPILAKLQDWVKTEAGWVQWCKLGFTKSPLQNSSWKPGEFPPWHPPPQALPDPGTSRNACAQRLLDLWGIRVSPDQIRRVLKFRGQKQQKRGT